MENIFLRNSQDFLGKYSESTIKNFRNLAQYENQKNIKEIHNENKKILVSRRNLMDSNKKISRKINKEWHLFTQNHFYEKIIYQIIDENILEGDCLKLLKYSLNNGKISIPYLITQSISNMQEERKKYLDSKIEEINNECSVMHYPTITKRKENIEQLKFFKEQLLGMQQKRKRLFKFDIR